MMREIKFRVWNGSKMEHQVLAGYVGHFFTHGINQTDAASISPFNTKYPDETPLMQYTGLKDKNGVEIYEGDIVLTDHNIGSPFGVTAHQGEIVYQTAAYGIKNGITITDLTVLYRNKWTLEVIGNIYGNKDLLDQS